MVTILSESSVCLVFIVVICLYSPLKVDRNLLLELSFQCRTGGGASLVLVEIARFSQGGKDVK